MRERWFGVTGRKVPEIALEGTVDRDLGHADAGRAEPALPHSSIVSPGSGASTSTSGASPRSSSGVPVRSGNVP